MNVATPEKKWTDALLDEMRSYGDPLADKAAAALFDVTKGHTEKEIGQFTEAFVSHDFAREWSADTVIKIPQEIKDYFANMDDFTWTEAELDCLENGALFFEKHGPWITFTLGVRSLLKQYAHTKAIEVLRRTTLLEKHVNRRILETMQFVLDVMSIGWDSKEPDGHLKLNPSHPGILSIKKLRLVHAMVRHRLLKKSDPSIPGYYDTGHFGYPINQEDMVFAIHTFSLEIIEGLRELRVTVSDADAENYFECWKIIGRGLGIRRELEPVNYDDAMTLQNKIYERHFTLPNETGPLLSKALINWFIDTVPLLGKKTLMTAIKDINGPENYNILAEHLNIPIHEAHDDLEIHLSKDLEFHEKTARAEQPHINSKGKLSLDNFFLHFLRTLLKTERGGKSSTFRIGDGFRAAWDLNHMSEKPLPKDEVFWMAALELVPKLWNYIKSLFSGQSKKT